MCSLRGGEGSVGTYLTLAQPVSQAAWTLSSPVEGLWPLPWVTACALQREEMAGVSLGAAGALVSGSCRKGLTLPPRVWMLSQQC